jgi:hypothetical protein
LLLEKSKFFFWEPNTTVNTGTLKTNLVRDLDKI